MSLPHLSGPEKDAIMREKYLASMKPVSPKDLLKGLFFMYVHVRMYMCMLMHRLVISIGIPIYTV